MVGGAHQRIEFQVNLGLAAGRDLVMMALNLQPAVLHGDDHLRAQVLIMIRGRHWEIAFLVSRAIAKIVFDPARIPPAFFRVDEIEPVLLALIETHVVEDKEFGLGPEIRRIGQTGRAQIHLGLAGNVAGIAVIALLGHGIDYVAGHHQRGQLCERIEHEGIRVGDEQHIALVNGRPAANGRAIHAEAFFKRGFRQLIDRIRNVMPQSRQVGEAQVKQLDPVLLHEFHYCFWISHEKLLLRFVVGHSSLVIRRWPLVIDDCHWDSGTYGSGATKDRRQPRKFPFICM